MKNVIFKALSNKSTLEQYYLRPMDYCIIASGRNLHFLDSTHLNYAYESWRTNKASGAFHTQPDYSSL